MHYPGGNNLLSEWKLDILNVQEKRFELIKIDRPTSNYITMESISSSDTSAKSIFFQINSYHSSSCYKNGK